MESPTLDGKVEGVVAGVLQMPAREITDALAMRDTDAWDSLKHMELVVALEEAFGLQLTFEEIVTMQSVGAIKGVLRARGALD